MHKGLFVATVLALWSAASGQDYVGWRNDSLPNVYGASKEQPFSRSLRKEPGAKQVFKDVAEWFEAVSLNVDLRRKESDGSECTLRGQKWIEASAHYWENRRIVSVDQSCATRKEHTTKSEVSKAFSLMRRAAAVVQAAGKKIVKSDSGIAALWGKGDAYAFANIQYQHNQQQCELDYIAALKKKSKWYIVAAVTSRDVRFFGRTRNRILEYVHEGFGNPLTPLLENKRANKTQRFTTEFVGAKGGPEISHLASFMRFENNQALSAALEANDLKVEQANDALTKSNVAILALPLMLSFIPVAMIADVSDAASFFYVLLTDVFSAVPFVIKGIELVQTGTTHIRKVETWLVGDTIGDETAETWAVECSPQDNFRVIGVAVILIGLAVIAIGIAIEYFARRWMAARREKGECPEPFGPALLGMDGYASVGAGFLPPDASYDIPPPNVAADVPAPSPAAPGPARGRVRALFSGMLLGRRGRQAAEAEDDRASLEETEPLSSQNFSGSVGVMRRRGNSDRSSEYEDVLP